MIKAWRLGVVVIGGVGFFGGSSYCNKLDWKKHAALVREAHKAFDVFAQEYRKLRDFFSKQVRRHSDDLDGSYFDFLNAHGKEKLFRARIAVLQQPEYAESLKKIREAGREFVQKRLLLQDPSLSRFVVGLDRQCKQKATVLGFPNKCAYLLQLRSPDDALKLFAPGWAEEMLVQYGPGAKWLSDQVFEQVIMTDLLH